MLRKEVPMLITVLSGLIIVFSQFFHYGKVLDLWSVADRWAQISFAFAVLVGAINLTRVHSTNVKRRRQDWVYSVVLLVALWGYIALGLYQSTEGKQFDWIYNSLMSPIGSTMYGSIAFFITSAAYRAFRFRTKEATVLMVAAIIVALGKAPIGDTLINGWGTAANWIVDVPSSGAMRGIQLGAFLGGVATALRILLGLERAHMGSGGA